MNRGVTGEHDRLIAAMIIPGKVVAVDLNNAKVRIDSRGWISPWVRWHSQGAGKARHWRAPSMGEQGSLLSPSGVPSLGTFIPGLYSEAGTQADNRDHVEAWCFDDGGSLVYDWEAKSYAITLPTGTVTTKVGASAVTVTDDLVQVKSGTIKLIGDAELVGSLRVTGDVYADGKIIDKGGNSPNHKH